MFGKLVKHEWSAVIRAMLPVYIATVIISVINGISINTEPFKFIGTVPENSFLQDFLVLFQGLLIFLYFAVLVGLCVLTLVVIIQRFRKGLLKEEGYLMFTLPVKVWQLVFSKALVAFFIIIVSCLVGLCAIGLLTADADFFIALASLPGAVSRLISEFAAESSFGSGIAVHIIIYITELLLILIIECFSSIYHFYVSMALGQLSRNHKVGFSVLWYIVISIITSSVGWAIMIIATGYFSVIDYSEIAVSSPLMIFHIFFIGLLAVNTAILAAFMGITNYVLGKKLNLE